LARRRCAARPRSQGSHREAIGRETSLEPRKLRACSRKPRELTRAQEPSQQARPSRGPRQLEALTKTGHSARRRPESREAGRSRTWCRLGVPKACEPLPISLMPERLREALAEGWHLHAGSMEYVPEGGGSHHWRAIDEDGESHFVTIDDLDDKDWMGDTREAVLDGLG
jgi:hypothetical protein